MHETAFSSANERAAQCAADEAVKRTRTSYYGNNVAGPTVTGDNAAGFC